MVKIFKLLREIENKQIKDTWENFWLVLKDQLRLSTVNL